MLKINDVKINNEMLSIIAEIDEYKGSWNILNKNKLTELSNLRTLATIESVGSSNRIEGNKLSDKDVEQFLSRINRKSFASRDEEEVAGYAELMDNIYDNYEIIPFNESYIKQLHQILLKYSTKDERHRGEYKKFPNSVAAYSSDGSQIGIIFETTTPFQTPEQMHQLIKTTKNILDDKIVHPLIIIGLFIVHFLAIHPFQDGNGRLSRVLTTLLLLKNGYTYIPYSSMESIIESSKEAYYRTLRQTQQSFRSEYDYTPWLMFFLQSLQKQKRRLEDKLKNITKISYSTEISQLDFDILNLFDKKQKLTVSEISETLSKNINTIKKRVSNLIQKNQLRKFGKTKGSWYERL